MPAGVPHIHHLNGMGSLDEFLQVHGLALLSIIHPLSPRCQNFSPILEEIAEALSTSKVEIECAQIDCVGNFDLVSRFGVKAYPTVVLCQASGEFKIYRGALRKEAILAFLRRKIMPAAVLDVNLHSFEGIRDMSDTVIVAYLGPDDGLLSEWFTAIADDMRDDFDFCTSSDHRLSADEKVNNTPSIVVYKTVAEEKSILQKFPSKEAVRGFIHLAVRPLVAEFLPELYEGILEQKAITDFLPTARKYQGRIQFGTVDVTDFPDLAGNMHIEATCQWPKFAIHDSIKNLRYPFTCSGEFASHLNVEEATRFVQEFLDGKLKPTIKSQPIRNSQAGPVIGVVGLSYKDVILDADKDVLVEFYTQWCGPCKALLPAYEQLGSLYASDSNARKLVTIAKIDYEANDVPDKDVRGFPWFKLYPAGEKDEPITYAGQPNVAGWVRFIAEKGTHRVELDTGTEV
ncbi:thioredoxin-domain-containing protein [Stipitochalara longipes BDJ]|nr:thioredoxin-domain-containing protein [Stipitochalara longipes BDJ]